MDNKKICRKTINFGKIDFYGTGRKINAVDVYIELRTQGGDEILVKNEKGEYIKSGKQTPVYIEFAASGHIWNGKHTDICAGGQCLDEIAEFVKDPAFIKIYEIWKYCLSITNIVFVIFLLVVIYSQLTGMGISNYGIKKTIIQWKHTKDDCISDYVY